MATAHNTDRRWIFDATFIETRKFSTDHCRTETVYDHYHCHVVGITRYRHYHISRWNGWFNIHSSEWWNDRFTTTASAATIGIIWFDRSGGRYVRGVRRDTIISIAGYGYILIGRYPRNGIIDTSLFIGTWITIRSHFYCQCIDSMGEYIHLFWNAVVGRGFWYDGWWIGSRWCESTKGW